MWNKNLEEMWKKICFLLQSWGFFSRSLPWFTLYSTLLKLKTAYHKKQHWLELILPALSLGEPTALRVPHMTHKRNEWKVFGLHQFTGIWRKSYTLKEIWSLFFFFLIWGLTDIIYNSFSSSRFNQQKLLEFCCFWSPRTSWKEKKKVEQNEMCF